MPAASSPPSPMLLHLQTVPSRNGMLWIRHGFKVFQRKPLALSGLLAAFVFLAFGTLLVPVVGVLLLLMSLPLLSLGFMLATHQVLQNQTPTAAVFFAPLKLTPQRRNSQLILCALYAIATLLVSLLSGWIDGGSFEAFQQLATSGAPAEQLATAAAEPRLFWGAVSRMGLAALLSVPFWHAPALVHWGGQGVMQSLFSSTLALWRNKAAFAINALMWAALMMSLGVISALLAGLLGLATLLPIMAVAIGLMVSTIFYASLYFTFVDCFMFGAPKDVLSDKA